MTTSTRSKGHATTTASVARLRARFEGRAIGPNDAGYDQARTVFYGGIDRRPALIVRARDARDVSTIVTAARDGGLELAVRSGGHSIARYGVSDGGIVLDLSHMKRFAVDVARRSAWAETGLTAGEYTTTAAEHGLATGFGDTGSVGIGGITLGGGIGFLVRKHGLTIDDLLAAEIVTADGQMLTVDAESHPDLFWAIRGGGGNFGVATRFEFRLHEVEAILGGTLILPATPDTVASFVAEAEHAREELSTIASVMVAPPISALPEVAHGESVIIAKLVYAGDVEAGERAVAPFRRLAKPFADTVKPMRYAEICPPDAGRHPVASTQTMFVDGVDPAAAQTMIDHLRASAAPMAAVEIRVLGGAMARVSADATAFAHRGARIMVNVAAMYERPDEAAVHEPSVDALAVALRQRERGAYVGFLRDEGEARVRDAYPGATWERLVAVKRRYDPENVFHLNHNVLPG